MELLLVLMVVAVLLGISLGKTVWFWLGLLVVSLAIGFRAYRIRCKKCGFRVISGNQMKFCNQCGVELKATRGLRLRCDACGGLTRSEFSLNFCNHCGTAV
jgi:rRNA maturation endonuclease Nob1